MYPQVSAEHLQVVIFTVCSPELVGVTSTMGQSSFLLSIESSTLIEACLAGWSDSSERPTGRAARAYLDVCFFHPFQDGNARCARLVLDFVLTRAGLGLHACEPLFIMSRSVMNEYDHFHFWRVLDQLVGDKPIGKVRQP